MKALRTRASLMFLVGCVVLLIVSVAVVLGVYATGFKRIERRDVQRNIARVHMIIQNEMVQLERLTADWAWWDDMYEYVDIPDEEFVTSNLPLSTFEDQNFAFALIIDADGETMFSRFVDKERGVFIPLSETLMRNIAPGTPLFAPVRSGKGVSGIMSLPEGPVVVASQPILTSEHQGPPSGVLVFGRWLDDEMLKSVSDQVQLRVDLYKYDSPKIPTPIRTLIMKGNESDVDISGDMVGVGVLRDIYENPALVFSLYQPREIHGLGMSVMRYHIAGIVLCIVAFAVLQLYLLNRFVLSRIRELGDQVRSFSLGTSFDDRISLPGGDELSELADNMNSMLARLGENEQFFTQILRNLNAGVLLVDEETMDVVEINPHALNIIGYDADEVIGSRCRDALCPRKDEGCSKSEISGIGESSEPEVRKLKRKDGTLVSVLKTLACVEWKGRRCILQTILDVTELEEAQNSLRETEKLYRTVFRNTGTASILVDDDTTILLANPMFENLVGRSSREIEGVMSWTDLFHPDDIGKMRANHKRRRSDPLSAPKMYEGRIRTRYGEIRDVMMSVAAVPGEALSVASLTDITEQKKAKDELVKLAFYDELTMLPNRSFLLEKIRQSVDAASRNGTRVGLLNLDLEDFKLVNDSFGHSKGDDILRMVAERLQEIMRKKDIIARVGGDEFLILIDDAKEIEDYARLAEAINERFRKPFYLQGRDIYLKFNIGISVFPDDGSSSPEGLIQNADMAMYQAKTSPSSSFSLFTADLNAKAMARLELEAEMRTAFKQKNFLIFYQPKINLETGEIIGAEALVRWVKPDGEIVTPNEFIPLAEETGLIVPLDNWVMKEAVERVQKWRDKVPPDFRISVNVSALHFNSGDLPGNIAHVLENSTLKPHQLGVEVTETLLMENMDRAVKILSEVADMGVRILLDDFGTGYSSLAYLSKLPINTLKIDKSFVMDITGRGSQGDTVARGILSLAANLGLEVVAEGVETAEQVQFLREHGCQYGQGYLFSKPVPNKDFALLLDQKKIVPD
ncbi:EAL domain-containing protein [Desulfobaculum bizertense]|uniref:PAS domain S-box-containing protein/diguanylate cyclase (GGDEF) domain-containing protein n=1 Tax=Desulfobaculum bizertense DSM 18034 TaxID=1121442 RepID=A0A1T4WT94_9BACT|nr:EAL domain-containing protein [Desulfobaculum bizertense]SKA79821.1 PAS domain S-box-containing protein/diguanylate cyclase (GGDEF) domain-containing protein [Desulfobaculum bizertense DSM 18034]